MIIEAKLRFLTHKDDKSEFLKFYRSESSNKKYKKSNAFAVARPPMPKKAHSTTSITKSSVISLSKNDDSSVPNIPGRKNTELTYPFDIVTFESSNNLPTTTIDWYPISNSFCISSLTNLPKVINNDYFENNGYVASPNILSRDINVSDKTTESLICDTSGKFNFSAVSSAAIKSLESAGLIPIKKERSKTEELIPSIKLLNRSTNTEPVLIEEVAEMIRNHIPKRYRLNEKWTLLYSIDQHGISLSTLYSLTSNHEGPCVLVIRDEHQKIFGGYLSESLHSQRFYYGTGECFLWKTSLNEKKKLQFETFHWSGKNSYLILSDNNCIAMGGGDGQFGLWLNCNLEKGFSDTCSTFDNETLSSRSRFLCMEMEIWGINF